MLQILVCHILIFLEFGIVHYAARQMGGPNAILLAVCLDFPSLIPSCFLIFAFVSTVRQRAKHKDDVDIRRMYSFSTLFWGFWDHCVKNCVVANFPWLFRVVLESYLKMMKMDREDGG